MSSAVAYIYPIPYTHGYSLRSITSLRSICCPKQLSSFEYSCNISGRDNEQSLPSPCLIFAQDQILPRPNLSALSFGNKTNTVNKKLVSSRSHKLTEPIDPADTEIKRVLDVECSGLYFIEIRFGACKCYLEIRTDHYSQKVSSKDGCAR